MHPKVEPSLAFKRFLAFVGDATMVAHNAKFDQRMINAALTRVHNKSSDAQLPRMLDERKIFCSRKLYRVFGLEFNATRAFSQGLRD